MRRLLLGLVSMGMLAGSAMADIPPPKTKPTSTKPKFEADAPFALGGTAIFAGVALSLAVVSGGLLLARKRFPRTSVDM